MSIARALRSPQSRISGARKGALRRWPGLALCLVLLIGLSIDGRADDAKASPTSSSTQTPEPPGASTSPETSPETSIDAQALVRHMDNLWRGTSSHTIMSMTVVTSRYQRKLSLEAWSRGMDDSMIVIRSPVKDKGIATLKVDKKIWNYLPKINRVTKIPSSMMSGSWMGSHFTNDDLVRGNTLEKDYDTEVTFAGNKDEQAVYELTAIPREYATVVWGKVVIWMLQESLAPLQAWYYDEDGAVVRKMVFDKRVRINDRLIPMRMVLRPIDKPDESTVMEYEEMEFDIDIDDSFFSLKNLKRQ